MSKYSTEELVQGFKKVFPPVVSEIMSEDYDLMDQWLGPEIKPFDRHMVVCGPAFTMRWVNDPELVLHTEAGKRQVADIMDALQPLWVPIVDSSKAPDSGYWGELVCNLCLEKGVNSAVIDGGVRDIDYILNLKNFNMFASFICPNTANKRSHPESFQKPIIINGVNIAPGDFIFGSIDGVIIIPQNLLDEVFEKTMKLYDEENKKRELFRQGYTYHQVLDMAKSKKL